MSFPDTITLTINSVAKVLNRVNQDSYGSEYQLNAALESVNLKIRHTIDSIDGDGLIMKRHNVFVEYKVYPTLTVPMQKFTSTVTVRHGSFNDPDVSSNLGKAVNVWLATSTNFPLFAAGVN